MQIRRRYPGKSAPDIHARVDRVMEDVSRRYSLHYEKDGKALTGRVKKMGITGTYAVVEGEVTVDLSFPMLIPASLRKKVTEDIEEKLDQLFA
ncbi:MAG TPA: polyhydroxyalkanoic acid system family protein [Anaeromyxobacteraceae bacterium]|nr:polyhydroxyalkanoic acid system family protein [Anaeromyxobacteraceae bacterium]